MIGDPARINLESSVSLVDDRFIKIRESIAGQAFDRLIDSQEQGIRDALIRLGWTPPSIGPDGRHSRAALEDLASRLTPNPAMTCAGTLAIILDGIDRLDDERLARSLAMANARQAGLDAAPLSDEQWAAGDIHSKLDLIRAAAAFKLALREMAK